MKLADGFDRQGNVRSLRDLNGMTARNVIEISRRQAARVYLPSRFGAWEKVDITVR